MSHCSYSSDGLWPISGYLQSDPNLGCTRVISVADESITGLVRWGLPAGRLVLSVLFADCMFLGCSRQRCGCFCWMGEVLTCCCCAPCLVSACLWVLNLLDSGLFGLFGGEE